MNRMITAIAALFLGTVLVVGPVSAHSGGLDKKGCHTNQKTNDYHCHKGDASETKAKEKSSSTDTKKSGKKASKAKSKSGRVKTTKVSSIIRGMKKKGTVVVFNDKGKVVNAVVSSKTKVYIGGKKVKRTALKKGLNCSIVYAVEKSQAQTIRCKSAGKKKAKAVKRKAKTEKDKK